MLRGLLEGIHLRRGNDPTRLFRPALGRLEDRLTPTFVFTVSAVQSGISTAANRVTVSGQVSGDGVTNPGFDVNITDSFGNVSATARTDANGNYSLNFNAVAYGPGHTGTIDIITATCNPSGMPQQSTTANLNNDAPVIFNAVGTSGKFNATVTQVGNMFQYNFSGGINDELLALGYSVKVYAPDGITLVQTITVTNNGSWDNQGMPGQFQSIINYQGQTFTATYTDPYGAEATATALCINA